MKAKDMAMEVVKGTWFKPEGVEGYPLLEHDEELDGTDLSVSAKRQFARHEVAPESYTVQNGWCARYSSMETGDCTDWVGPYATVQLAETAAREMHEDEVYPSEQERFGSTGAALATPCWIQRQLQSK